MDEATRISLETISNAGNCLSVLEGMVARNKGINATTFAHLQRLKVRIQRLERDMLPILQEANESQ